MTLKVIGFIIGVFAGLGCMAALISIFGDRHFGMAGGSTLVAILVGGFAQRYLISRFMPKVTEK